MGRFLKPGNPVGKFTPLAEIKICVQTETKENSLTTKVWVTVVSNAQTRVGENGSILQKQNACNFPMDIQEML